MPDERNPNRPDDELNWDDWEDEEEDCFEAGAAPADENATVQVGLMPGGEVVNVNLTAGENVIAAGEAFRRAGLSTANCEISVNHETVDASHPVQRGDVVLAFRRIKGNDGKEDRIEIVHRIRLDD